jgi:RNA polymerase sigma-70 factor (sigma-E family)
MRRDGSFDQFALQSSTRLLRTAFLLTGDRGAAEDLLQAALVRTARRWKVASESPDAYAYQVLTNLARDRHRRAERRVSEQPLADGAGATVVDHAHRVVERDAVLAAVKLLSARQREVVVLRFYAGLSVAETASAIGSSQGSVKTHGSRAFARLRELLSDGETTFDEQRAEVPGAE